MPDGPIGLIQLVPLVSLEKVTHIDVQEAYSDYQSFMFSGWGGASNAFNLDGVVFYVGSSEETVPSFTQVHRTGKLEAFRTATVSFHERKMIPSQTIAEFFRESIRKFAAFATKYNISAPYVLNAALLDVEGYQLALDDRAYFFKTALADRKHLILPSLYFENDFTIQAEGISKELLDILWQCFGLSRCTYYNDQKQWIAR